MCSWWKKEQGDADVIAQDILQVLEQALTDFNAMREREGQKLAEDVRAKAAGIAALVGKVEERSPETVSEYREKAPPAHGGGVGKHPD